MKTIELTHDQLNSIVINDLKEIFSSLIEDIKKFKKIENPPKYKSEDYVYNKKLLKATKIMLKYYLFHDEYEEFIKNNS